MILMLCRNSDFLKMDHEKPKSFTCWPDAENETLALPNFLGNEEHHFEGVPFKQSSLFTSRLIEQMITSISRNIKTQQQWISQQWITHLSSFIFVLGKSSQLFPNKLHFLRQVTSTVCWTPSDTMWILNHNIARLVVASNQSSWCLCWNHLW